MLGVVVLVSGACRVKPAQEQSGEYVRGCVSNDHTFRELLDECTQQYGTEFLLLDDVERDLDRMSFTVISCFIPEGTKASDLKLSANIELVQQMVLRSRAKADLGVMIDREPMPGTTNTYRIYLLPREGSNPWSGGVNGH
jgi:hypothetical protein